MPRVLTIINRLNIGGPTAIVAYLTKYLTPEFETKLVSGMIDETEGSSEFITEQLGVEPIYIPEMHREIDFLNDRKAYKRIKKIIQEYKPDIVHTHAAKAGTLGRLAASACNVPVILHTFHGHVFHSYFSPLKTRFFLEIERYLASKSTAIIAISDRQKRELGLIYKVAPLEDIKVIPIGFDLHDFTDAQEEKRKQFRIKYQIQDDEIVISIVGRLVPVKNHPLFIDAFKTVFQNTDKKVRAFIVGDGEERQNIINYLKEQDLDFVYWPQEQRTTPVTLTSWHKDVDVVYAGSDIVALTSNNEGTPVSLIEAQAANKPIVTTRVGGISDVVIPNVTALVSTKGNVSKLAKNLFILVQDEELRRQISEAGRAFVLNRFSYSRLVSDTALLYKELLSGVR